MICGSHRLFQLYAISDCAFLKVGFLHSLWHAFLFSISSSIDISRCGIERITKNDITMYADM